MEPIRHSDLIYLAGAVLAGIALLLLACGLANGDAGRVDVAEAAVAGSGDRVAAGAGEPSVGTRRDPRGRTAGAAEPATVAGTATLTVRSGASVALRDAPGGAVVETLGDTTEFGSPTVLSVAKRDGAWAGVPTELRPNGELGWVKVDRRRLDPDSVGQKIIIDLSEMRGELFRRGELERRWTVGIGGPGTPTPTGHFSITDELQGGLNPVYGCCAIALSATQPNLPAGWTGGNRIAIHGTSEQLGEANSTGCVHSGDGDLRALIEAVPLGTPVTIRR